MFQSTHPHGVRLCDDESIYLDFLFQSTHPHGVRRSRGFHACESPLVSIHAPTRGATLPRPLPPRGRQFQSTHPHGVRQSGLWLLLVNLRVSIHAPTRGATILYVHTSQLLWVSIHAPTRGATPMALSSSDNDGFQSTHPHGVRPAWIPS